MRKDKEVKIELNPEHTSFADLTVVKEEEIPPRRAALSALWLVCGMIVVMAVLAAFLFTIGRDGAGEKVLQFAIVMIPTSSSLLFLDKRQMPHALSAAPVATDVRSRKQLKD